MNRAVKVLPQVGQPDPSRYAPPRRGHVEIEEVSVTFGSGAVAHLAVEATTLDIQPGEFVCLLGPSGCGKSSLLNAVAGHIQPSAGEVRVDGQLVRGPAADRGMVFQQHSLLPWMTVWQNVALGPRLAGEAEPESIATTFLDIVGLSKFANRYPAELSGGMQQRVGIARALANYPRVLLMDEPFGALDAQTRLVMQENLLQIWKQFKTTVLFVTHDVDEAIFLGDRVLVMSAAPGRVIADIPVSLTRPRLPETGTEPEFVSIKRQCLALIRQESQRAFLQQNE